MRQTTLAGDLAAINTATINAYGTTVTLPGGQTFSAEIVHTGHELIRSNRDEGDVPEKRPIVLVFPAAAWGVVLENMTIVIGTGAMARNFAVAAPLHPQWVQGQVVELQVAAYPD